MKVFISYSHDDQPKVKSRVHALKETGLEVFWDQDVPPGMNWIRYLTSQLNEASFLVVFVTRASAHSDFILNEISVASVKKSPIIAVYLEEMNQAEVFDNPVLLLTSNIRPIMAKRLSVTACCSQIREAILNLSRTDSRRCPVLSVTGVQGGVGKSTMVMAMSELIASAGHNVMLIDLDTGSAGLTRYVQDRPGPRPRVNAVKEVILGHRDDGGNASFPKAGSWDVTPSYLSDQERFGRILLVPARNIQDTPITENLEPTAALALVRQLVANALENSKRIDCVIIDCPADNSRQVSGTFVAANYGFIVSRPKTSFASDIRSWENTHRDRFPNERLCEISVVVNMSVDETPARWSGLGIPVKAFLPDSATVRQRGRDNNNDFEGVGLSNFFLAVLHVLITCFSNNDKRLIPDESKIWIKPYLETMKTFPESLLRHWRFRWLTPIAVIVAMLGLMVAVLASWSIYRLNRAPSGLITIRPISGSQTVSETQFKEILRKIEIPSDLANTVAIDHEHSELALTGTLSTEDVARLKALSEYEPWKDVVVGVSALADAKASEMSMRNQELRTWYFAGAIAGLGLLVYAIWSHVIFARRKLFLQGIVTIRNSNNDAQMETRIKELLSEDKKAKPHLAWVRQQFRRQVPGTL